MKSKVLSVVMALVIMLGLAPFFGVHEVRAAVGWQTAYAKLLSNLPQTNEPRYFTLYDIDLDGVPELFVIDYTNRHNGIYTFNNDKILPLYVESNDLSDGVDDFIMMYLISGSSRMELCPPAGNAPGLIGSWSSMATPIGPSEWGYVRYVLDGDKLIIDIDLSTEHDVEWGLAYELDEDELNRLIESRTQRFLNGDIVSKEVYDNMYETIFKHDDNRSLDSHPITADNITRVIYGAQNNTIAVTINGQRVNFTGQAPAIIDGRTLVPVRGVFEALGFGVSWNEQTRQVTLSKAKDTIVITLDSTTFTTNGKRHTLDVPAQIIGGRTMLPLRAVLESVGYRLGWDEATHTVIVTVN